MTHLNFSRDLSLALGTHAVTPLDVATGYAIFANGGYRVAPYLVSRIENIEGDIIYTATPDTVCKQCEEQENQAAALAEGSADIYSSPDELLTTQPQPEESAAADYDIEGDAFQISAQTKAMLGLIEPGDLPASRKKSFPTRWSLSSIQC